MYYVYIVKCSDNSLYTGTASDICRRMHQHVHRSRDAAKYTRSHPVKELCALWRVKDKSLALKAESAIKKLKREYKIKLISCPDDIFGLIPDLCGETCMSIFEVTLDECVLYTEKKMSEDEKALLFKKLNKLSR